MADALPILLWLVPLLPFAAAGILAFLPDAAGRRAAPLAIGAIAASCVCAFLVFGTTLGGGHEAVAHRAFNFPWFTFGEVPLQLGLLLDPLGAAMAAMVTFVSAWIFVYSIGYMETDRRFGRFFGFLSLFAGAMLLLVLSNSLLLLFIAWELVGLASYLLIGFYFDKPAAAAAAQKAFITTRIGDLAFLLGMLWLYSDAGTLLFYDNGAGLLESDALASLAGITTGGGLAVSAAASLLLLVGAMGKSGQVPLHVWLPDAMEGPTPVSALIHAATMVAAGVFLVARMHPLFSVGAAPDEVAPALAATAWVGAATALFAAIVAVGQNDIKRILAYSTISQLGFMMVALGTGGMGAGMFHLIAHAFFKALLFLSAGSVIHGCRGEQDIRRMGGLVKEMPWTFLTYATGMMALAGFPFVFSGFWSKEAVLHSAEQWPGGHGPFLLAVAAALLTAFYMTRQALLVFFGRARKPGVLHPHESPASMLTPMFVLAAGTILLVVVGTPAWPWLESYLAGHPASLDFGALIRPESLKLIALSLALVTTGVGLGWKVFQREDSDSTLPDPIEHRTPGLWKALGAALYFDAFNNAVVIRLCALCGALAAALERFFFLPLLALGESLGAAFARITGEADHRALNRGFNGVCDALRSGASATSRRQSGRPQTYLRAIGIGMAALVFLYLWISW